MNVKGNDVFNVPGAVNAAGTGVGSNLCGRNLGLAVNVAETSSAPTTGATICCKLRYFVKLLSFV